VIESSAIASQMLTFVIPSRQTNSNWRGRLTTVAARFGGRENGNGQPVHGEFVNPRKTRVRPQSVFTPAGQVL
jgi:hypothetical protein